MINEGRNSFFSGGLMADKGRKIFSSSPATIAVGDDSEVLKRRGRSCGGFFGHKMFYCNIEEGYFLKKRMNLMVKARRRACQRRQK